MFKLDLSPTYTVPVTIQVRGEDGEIKPETFRAEFLRMGPAEFDDYLKHVQHDHLDDADVSLHILRGWSGITTDAGEPVPFSAETRYALLKGVTGAASAIARTWHASVMEEIRKNLLPPPATGPAATVEPMLIE